MCEWDYDWILICSKSLQCATLHRVRHGRSVVTYFKAGLCCQLIKSPFTNSDYDALRYATDLQKKKLAVAMDVAMGWNFSSKFLVYPDSDQELLG